MDRWDTAALLECEAKTLPAAAGDARAAAINSGAVRPPGELPCRSQRASRADLTPLGAVTTRGDVCHQDGVGLATGARRSDHPVEPASEWSRAVEPDGRAGR